jgi:hypothetical protein
MLCLLGLCGVFRAKLCGVLPPSTNFWAGFPNKLGELPFNLCTAKLKLSLSFSNKTEKTMIVHCVPDYMLIDDPLIRMLWKSRSISRCDFLLGSQKDL